MGACRGDEMLRWNGTGLTCVLSEHKKVEIEKYFINRATFYPRDNSWFAPTAAVSGNIGIIMTKRIKNKAK
ncbi:MAG: hypothetical protein ACYCX4_17450 [Bacillota bacterium]